MSYSVKLLNIQIFKATFKTLDWKKLLSNFRSLYVEYYYEKISAIFGKWLNFQNDWLNLKLYNRSSSHSTAANSVEAISDSNSRDRVHG